MDPDRIGALGVCASGGYVPHVAQTQRRIKAVATVSAVCLGGLFRDGLASSQSREALLAMLEAGGKDRTEQALGKPARLEHMVPDTLDNFTAGTPHALPW